MITQLHSRLTRFVEKQIFLSLLDHFLPDEDGQPRKDALVLCGDGGN